jgi:hypothetical protein
MSNPNRHATHAWIITDARGRIQAISSGAHQVLGLPRLGRGDDLPSRFSFVKKALVTDMEVALTGWPTERTIVLTEISRRPVAVRYRVSRKWSTEEVELFWLLGLVEREERLLCA